VLEGQEGQITFLIRAMTGWVPNESIHHCYNTISEKPNVEVLKWRSPLLRIPKSIIAH
jgi:hypothetical protein